MTQERVGRLLVSLDPSPDDGPTLAADSAARRCPGCNVPLEPGEARCALCTTVDGPAPTDGSGPRP